MPDDAWKPGRKFADDSYRLMRIETERAVADLLSLMRRRSDDAIDRFMLAGEDAADPDDAADPTQGEIDRISDIRLSHSTAFAHALLQGAADAFEDHKMGLTLLKKLIEVELAELEHAESFTGQATSAGSNAIN